MQRRKRKTGRRKRRAHWRLIFREGEKVGVGRTRQSKGIGTDRQQIRMDRQQMGKEDVVTKIPGKTPSWCATDKRCWSR